MNTAFLKSYETLSRIYTERAFSSIALNQTLLHCKAADKALITKVVYGVLDNDIKLDYVISRHVKKMPKGDTLLFLKIGAYCLAELSIPVYAVVNDIAELSKLSEDRRIVGFVNATLKSIAASIKTFDDYPLDPIERLSVEYSYPLWALKKLVKDFGLDVATDIVTHPLDNRTTVRVSAANLKTICENYSNLLEPTPFDDAFYAKGNLPSDGGESTVQSLASMAVARICADKLCQGGSFIDCCAAPGGKSVYVKQIKPSVNVTSCDIHPHRVELINSYAKRMGVQLITCCVDNSAPNDNNFVGAFDVVLCDVPCSGFGVLNTRPDIKLFRQNKDISELMKLQYAILNNCATYVKKGGYLVYSTCTVFDNENGQNIRKFLAENANFCYDTIYLPQFENANGKGYYQFLPHKDGVQGFFVAVMKNIEN